MKDKYSIQRIALLHPLAIPVFTSFIEECEKTLGVTLRIAEGYRSFNDQYKRYAQGRTMPGKIVSYAPAGYSYHEYGLAVDLFVVNADGSINWAYDMKLLAPIAAKYGITCGTSFSRAKVDPPHFEIHFGYDIHTLFGMRNAKKVDAKGWVLLTNKAA